MIRLTHEIIKYIFSKLGIQNDNLNKLYSSLMDPEFLSNKTINLIDGDKEFSNKIWSSKFLIEEKEFKILLADCSIENNKEYALLVSFSDSPDYACYLTENYQTSMIGINAKSGWIQAPMFVQANFLAGMEQIKDLKVSWSKNDDISDMYTKVVSFIEYYEFVVSTVVQEEINEDDINFYPKTNSGNQEMDIINKNRASSMSAISYVSDYLATDEDDEKNVDNMIAKKMSQLATKPLNRKS